MTVQEWLYSKETVKRSMRSYAHFDLRTDLSHKRNYISSPEKITKHGFYPFIHYKIKTTVFNRATGIENKERDICYAAHIDRCIYQYYSFLLNQLYNKRVEEDDMYDVAVAYRTDLHTNNIFLAKKAFTTIQKLGQCYVMIGDFTHFFDTLNHNYLKEQWCSLLSCDTLPADHYSVFKSVTSYSKWELEDLLQLNGLENSKSGRKELNKKSRVLSIKKFKENRSHIIKHTQCFGIPQGSPISAVLANIYMLDFDKTINNAIRKIGGLYMRYSDDFIIIIPNTEGINAKKELNYVQQVVDNTPNITLKPQKTQYFYYKNGFLYNCGIQFSSDANNKHKFINFLGFTFDGMSVSIRAKTISKYYYRMYRKAKTIAKSKGYTQTGKHISCENLYRKYSKCGATISPGNSGNFLTYVSRAELEYRQNDLNADNTIIKDTKHHMAKIRKALNKK